MAVSASSSASPNRAQLPVLTGLRFAAAFAVLIGHTQSTLLVAHTLPGNAVYWAEQASGFGMTLFFVLSGFVIHYNYAGLVGAGRLGRYLWARFARLYPLYFLMLCVYIAVSSKFHGLARGQTEGFDAQLTALPYFLISVQSWIYRPIGHDPLVSAIGGASPLTWSISTEWFFYFAYPAIAVCVLRLRRWPTIIAAALGWCIVWAILCSGLYELTPGIDVWAVAYFGPPAGFYTDEGSSFVRWLLYLSPYVRIGEFILGCLTAQGFLALSDIEPGPIEGFLGKLILAVALVSVPVITYLMYSAEGGALIFQRLNMNFGLARSVALLLFCASRYDNVVSRLFSSWLIVRLGEASYSIYLIHYVVLLAVQRSGLAPSEAAHGYFGLAMIEALVVITAILAASWALYASFEVPCRKWLRNMPRIGSGWSRRAAAIAMAPALLAAVVYGSRQYIVGWLDLAVAPLAGG